VSKLSSEDASIRSRADGAASAAQSAALAAQHAQATADSAQRKTEENRLLLARIAARSAVARKGKDDVLLGQMYLSYGQYDQAIDALTRGINKGGLEDGDEAQVSLGIAYLNQGRKQPAEQAFQAVGKGSKWAGLAELWMLRAVDLR
jgi:tetratricopeptide (TPR) repeat protein